jgi:mannose-1-phosphate guanylyltransferase/mannose-6-phosphate isomerase
MITVIIAGGSGTRLWPLSTPEHPKHLLKLTGDRSLLQTAYDRAARIGNKTYVVTEASHSDQLRKQLPELPDDAFLIEPGRRGTAHCIIFALDAISRKHDKAEPVAFIHSDHHIRNIDGFVDSFLVADEVSRKNNEIVLIGIEPTFPSTGFGYIERANILKDNGYAHRVKSFKEKPDYDTAQKYVESGKYLWNCGYFVGSVNTFMAEIKRSAANLQKDFDSLAAIPVVGSADYNEAYLALDNQVIDIALIEKAKSLAVVSASFDWMDIGSFKDLHDAMPQDAIGNHIRGNDIYLIDVKNSYISNNEEKPIAVIGLDNVIVVNTPDGILISRKDSSHLVGDIAKKIQA